ncbi:copper resistance CopC family protein [Ornithinimicrobium cryptoxanthini]|uniref:copper resistance CopC family protein n=1 Tax=Ornithinimicrobium cryptoxanthini TaxID=2934161 RepID=UPI002118C962|nr:copper resistance CopC family protein [Ornithinimicrobium cryptoxanthini]
MFTLSTRGRRPGGRTALGALLLTLWLTLLAAPASAHDSLVDSDPAQDAVLTEVPSQLELTFSGEISDLGVQFVVIGPEERDVVQGTPTVSGTVVTQTLTEELVDGDYEATWRVTSSDGHPISGTIGFSIADATTSRSGDRGEATATDGGTAAPTSGAVTEDTETTAPTATPSPTEAATPAPADDAAVTAEAAPDPTTESSGIPTWGWLVAALAAVGLVACGFLAFRRN